MSAVRKSVFAIGFHSSVRSLCAEHLGYIEIRIVDDVRDRRGRIELSHRIVKDSLWNYFKSVYQTIRIRQFLKQDELSETITFNENQTVTRLNPILREFNQSVSKCSIDIHNDEITVFMKIPRTQQSQKLLRDMEEHIREEISSYNPNYYFSIPVRARSGLWFKGTKR